MKPGEADSAIGPNPTRRLGAILTSPVVAALISVLGTAVLGNWIASRFQDRAKKNEAALQLLRDDRSARIATVKEALTLVGEYVAASEDLITVTDPAFRVAGRSEGDRDDLLRWKKQVRETHDKVDFRWRQQSESLGYVLLYHVYGERRVLDDWRALSGAASGFEKCAREWYMERGDDSEARLPAELCETHRAKVRESMRGFTDSLRNAERAMYDSRVS